MSYAILFAAPRWIVLASDAHLRALEWNTARAARYEMTTRYVMFNVIYTVYIMYILKKEKIYIYNIEL